MATVTLVDFQDIYTAICEELKVQLTDGATVARIKRDINMIYLSHVIPFKPRAWWWLEKNQDVQTYAKVTAGTINIVNDSTTVTFSTAPTGSLVGYYLRVGGYEEIIEITTHTAAATTATLKSAWRRGTVTAQGFTAWKDNIALDSDMKEITQVTHDKMSVPLELCSSTKLNEKRARSPAYEAHPMFVTLGDFDTSGNRVLRFFPACDDIRHTLHVQGIQEATRLSADADEPMMPLEDRIVLFYGACSRAWSRERNESEANKNWQQFMQKLGQMAAKSDSAPKKTEMSVDPDYLINKRYRRLSRARRGSGWRSD